MIIDDFILFFFVINFFECFLICFSISFFIVFKLEMKDWSFICFHVRIKSFIFNKDSNSI